MISRQPTIKLLSVADIVRINRKLGEREKVEYSCLDMGRIESALCAAYYPGIYPLANGGVAEVAGALCYFLVMAHAFSDGNKRTGAIDATAFLAINGFELKFPLNPKRNVNAFAEMVLACADGKITKDEVRRWFDAHKARISAHSQS
jgi:prophage maintenance system killer protein